MNPLLSETLELRHRYDEEPSHSDHVTKLALLLFNDLQSWHGLGPRERDLLHAAALLHDIGWSQSADGAGHHKASAHLIEHYPWKNLAKDEISIVAQTARYHRKSLPKSSHPGFQALPKPAQKLVRVLAGILRVADALDRTHSAAIPHLTARVEEEALVITVQPLRVWNAERAMAEEKADLLELTAERSVRVVEKAQGK